ncbi:MAG: LysM peptidoglycan-binding domain-containing protein, partial [Planctomycetota bacterium]
AAGSAAPASGLSGPVAAKLEQPLRVAAPTPAALVRQQVGPYRRDHTVRFVTAKKGDTFSHLALRWCGKVSPYVDEIRYLNETTNVLKEGQTVGVPWVDDEVILAGLEAQAAPTIRGAVETSLSNTLAGGASSTPAGSPRPAGQGSFRREPKLIERLDAGPASGGVAVDTVVDPLPPAAPAFTDYKVQPNDSLWKILAKKFGNGKVPKLLGPVREMNPDVNFDNLQIGVTIKLPTSAE